MAALNAVLAYLAAIVHREILFTWPYMHISEIACSQNIMSCL